MENYRLRFWRHNPDSPKAKKKPFSYSTFKIMLLDIQKFDFLQYGVQLDMSLVEELGNRNH